jgi:hypothetical protein
MTTNGLQLKGDLFDRLCAARPDKVHVSIHFPKHDREVDRVIAQVARLAECGIRSGVNLLVARSGLADAAAAAARLRTAGIGNERIVYLPMRGRDTPTPGEVARVAGDSPFQSMSCLSACAKSPRYCSIDSNRSVAWCSYTRSRRQMRGLTYAALMEALDPLPLVFCGDVEEAPKARKEINVRT